MGPTQLYLDTARLGRMSSRRRQALVDFARLAEAEGGSAFFEHFLRAGASEWSSAIGERYPGLVCWQGVAPLKRSLRLLAGSDPSLPVLMANRSAQLMKLAARLFHSCRNVLVTDLGWPPYHDILTAEAQKTERTVTIAPLQDAILRERLEEQEVVGFVRDWFLRCHCDGLFLTAVNHLGIRLPVERIVRALEATTEVRFVVLDGAQDFCHVAADLCHEYCDLYLAGCHKWLGGYHPMGLAFYGRRRSRGVIDTALNHLIRTGELDDPLLRFSTQLEEGGLNGWTETVNVISLFSCQGAVADALEARTLSMNGLPCRLANAAVVVEAAAELGWQPLVPPGPFRTGILLLQAQRGATNRGSSHDLRTAFSERGVALTTYDNCVVRLSMPSRHWQPCELDQLREALCSVG